jgi:hypothetical protein
MNLRDIIAYGLMCVASMVWAVLLFRGVGLSKILAVVSSLVLGPATVILAAFVVAKFFEPRNK